MLTATQCATYDEVKRYVMSSLGWSDGINTQLVTGLVTGEWLRSAWCVHLLYSVLLFSLEGGDWLTGWLAGWFVKLVARGLRCVSAAPLCSLHPAAPPGRPACFYAPDPCPIVPMPACLLSCRCPLPPCVPAGLASTTITNPVDVIKTNMFTSEWHH